MVEESNYRTDRTGRRLSGTLETFELDKVIDYVRNEEEYSNKGHNALTLVKGEVLRTVLICLKKGQQLHDHRAPGPITVSVLRGRAQFDLEPFAPDSRTVELDEGQLLVLEQPLRHAVTALADCAILLHIISLKSV